MAIEARSRVPSAAANGKHGHTLISNEKFRQLYALALQLRLLAERGIPGAAAGEAALAGVAADLRADDVLLSAAQPHLTATLHGILPRGLREPLPGEVHDLSESLVAAISGAAADRIRKNGRVTVVLTSPEMPPSVLKEAWTTASGARLPVLFVETAAGEATSDISANDMPVIPVDAQDVIAIYRVAHESITRAREGSGPTRMQCIPWQPAAGSRTRQEAGSADAITHLEEWLTSRGLPAQQWRQEIAAHFEQRIRETEAGNDLENRRKPMPNGWSIVEGAASQQSV